MPIAICSRPPDHFRAAPAERFLAPPPPEEGLASDQHDVSGSLAQQGAPSGQPSGAAQGQASLQPGGAASPPAVDASPAAQPIPGWGDAVPASEEDVEQARPAPLPSPPVLAPAEAALAAPAAALTPRAAHPLDDFDIDIQALPVSGTVTPLPCPALSPAGSFQCPSLCSALLLLTPAVRCCHHRDAGAPRPAPAAEDHGFFEYDLMSQATPVPAATAWAGAPVVA